jgi:hypothetical protein
MTDTHVTEAPKAKKQFLSFSQRLAVLNKLKEVCTRTTDGFSRYAPGWDDDTVAAAMGKPVNSNHVRSLRQEMIGLTERSRTQSDLASIEARVTQIEEYLTRQNPNWKAAQ